MSVLQNFFLCLILWTSKPERLSFMVLHTDVLRPYSQTIDSAENPSQSCLSYKEEYYILLTPVVDFINILCM
jgi:hypothetical protein